MGSLSSIVCTAKGSTLRAFPAHTMNDRNQLTACTQPPGHHPQERHSRQPADVHRLLKPVLNFWDAGFRAVTPG